MRRLISAVTFVLLATAIAAAQSAQAKPSFAGKWALADPGAAAGPMTSPTMTVTQDEKVFTLVTASQMGEIKTVFNLDGTEGKSPIEIQGMTIPRTTKSAWDGNKLVLTTVSDIQGQSFETKQVWALNADGTVTIDSTRPDFQGGGAPVTAKLVYKKQ